MEQKKVCILADTHGLYDDRIYWKEALSLKRKGYRIVYILIGDKSAEGTTDAGIAYRMIKRKKFLPFRILNYLFKLWFFIGEYREMFQYAAEEKADVYHFHDLRINRIGKKLKKLRHNPVVIYDVHEPHAINIRDYRNTPSFLEFLKNAYADYVDRWEKRCASGYDLIITTEENVKEQFQEKLPQQRAEIIYNYTDLHRFRTNIPYEERKYDAIYCGGITELRGAMQILKAIAMAKESKPGLSVVFLGKTFPDSLSNEMREFIHAHGLEGNVILHPPVPYREVVDFYNNSRTGIAVFLPAPTHKVILQIKIFEYMCFGLPVIGSNFGHVKDYIEKDSAGIIVDPESPEKIAESLVKLLNDRNIYEKYSSNAREAADSKYRWEFMEEKLAALYRELLTGGENG